MDDLIQGISSLRVKDEEEDEKHAIDKHSSVFRDKTNTPVAHLLSDSSFCTQNQNIRTHTQVTTSTATKQKPTLTQAQKVQYNVSVREAKQAEQAAEWEQALIAYLAASAIYDKDPVLVKKIEKCRKVEREGSERAHALETARQHDELTSTRR